MSEKFFQTKAYYSSRLKAVSRRMGFDAKTHTEWQFWRQEAKATLTSLLGLERMISTDLSPVTTEVVQCDGYKRERVEIAVEPGVIMPLYVLVPDILKTETPAILAPHGHVSGGKISPAGVVEIPGVGEKVREYNYDYGVQAVKRGYIVFCPDARGMGERRESAYEAPENLFNRSCDQLYKRAIPLGLSVAGMWTWDLIRLLDYVQTRNECKNEKIGCIGLSGGGLQTLYLSAIDERVDCAVISGYFYGVHDSLLEIACCDCNYVPHLWEYFDMGDLGALIAPHPVLIESGTQDDLNGTRGIINVKEQFEITQQAFDLLGVTEKVAIDIFEGGHRWHGTVAWDFLNRWLH
jgi:dienelactone hydrolase